MFAYKNINTGQIVHFREANSRLETLNNWTQVPATDVPSSVAVAADRAEAQRRMIASAAALRFDSAAGAAAAGLAHAEQVVGPRDASSEPLPTAAMVTAVDEQSSSLVGMLDKADPVRKVDGTAFEVNKAAAEREIENPPRDGVLARAKRDQKTGATQINDAHADEIGGLPGGVGAAVPLPATGAPKPDWVAYAVAQGMSESKAAGLTKTQLIEQFAPATIGAGLPQASQPE